MRTFLLKLKGFLQRMFLEISRKSYLEYFQSEGKLIRFRNKYWNLPSCLCYIRKYAGQKKIISYNGLWNGSTRNASLRIKFRYRITQSSENRTSLTVLLFQLYTYANFFLGKHFREGGSQYPISDSSLA